MGMFDRVHTMNRCGQVKCWGQKLTDWTIGCRPRLYVRLEDGGTPALLDLRERTDQGDRGPDRAGQDGSAPRGWEQSDLTDYQVIMTDGFLVIRDGEWVDWSDDQVDDLVVVDNAGRDIATTTERVQPGWSVPVSKCDVCSPEDFGDIGDGAWTDSMLDEIRNASRHYEPNSNESGSAS